MKKYLIIFIIIIFVSLLISKSVYKAVTNGAVNFIAYLFEQEEFKREEKINNGDVVWGKDTVLIWENKYDITRHMGEKSLAIHIDGLSSQIIDKIIKYKVKNDKLFILSKEGYAVIDRDKICRVYITVPEEEFINGNESRKIESEYIIYLSSLNEFAKEEQEILNSL